MKEDSGSITSNDFIEFLLEKCQEGKCAGCGGETFKLLSSPEAGLWIFEQDVKNEDGYHLQTYAMNCADCGCVRHHVAWRVREWVLARRETSKVSESKAEDND